MTDYTHKKKTYYATCVQWNDNTDQVTQLLQDVCVEVTPYGDALMLRRQVIEHARPFTKIDMFYKGMWVRIGENGAMKLMTDDEFKLKYEPI